MRTDSAQLKPLDDGQKANRQGCEATIPQRLLPDIPSAPKQSLKLLFEVDPSSSQTCCCRECNIGHTTEGHPLLVAGDQATRFGSSNKNEGPRCLGRHIASQPDCGRAVLPLRCKTGN